MAKKDFDNYFHEDACVKIFSEMQAWTSVDDCLVVARSIENRPDKNDHIVEQLVVPFLDDDRFQMVLSQCIAWLIKSFRVSEAKIKVSKCIDPEMEGNSESVLRSLKFLPDVKAGPANTIDKIYPMLANHKNDRFFVIKDHPYVIEVIQNPIRCLIDIISRVWPTARKMFEIKQAARDKTGGASTIFYQPYSDGPLFSLIESLVFYVHDLGLGVNYSEKSGGINMGFRSVDVVCRPPVNSSLFTVAKAASVTMFKNIGS